MKTALIIIAAALAISGAGWLGWMAVKWFILGKNLRKSHVGTSVLSLVLAALIGVGSILVPGATAPETTNADNGGWSINPAEQEVNMSGFGTKAQVLAFLREGFGDKFDEVMNTVTDYDLLAVDAEGKSVDEAKIKANKAYLEAIGYGKQFPDGFRGAVVFPSSVITPEIYKTIGNMTAEEQAELFNRFRWEDVYYRNMTSLRYLDMSLQLLETYPEFVQQNDMWAPALRELIEKAKTDEDELNNLYVTEADGSMHLIEDVQIYAGMVCMTMQHAVIKGIEAPKSILHWELPGMSVAQESRWTQAIDDPDKQEELPAVIFVFPNTKSGQDAYKAGYNTADLRAEKFNPEEDPAPVTTTPPPDNPPPTVTTVTKKVTIHYLEDKTNAVIQQPTTSWKAVGSTLSLSAPTISGWNYVRSEGPTSGTMPNKDIDVYFYYNRTQTRTTTVKLTVEHRDADTNALLKSEGPFEVAKGSSQPVSANYSAEHYIYLNNSLGNSRSSVSVTVNEDMKVIFYYYREYKVTTQYKDWDTKEVIHAETRAYYRQGTAYKATALTNIAGYTYYMNSAGNTNTSVMGTTPANDDTVVVFYYKKNAQSFTVTTLHKDTSSGRIMDTETATVKAGEHYSTSVKDFPGYIYSYHTGDATSGTMPNRNITVIYWYKLKETDGNGTKNPNADPAVNGTGNATEGIGPGHGEEDPYVPDHIYDTPEQKGNEPTANHYPTDNPGGQAAGSDWRQGTSGTTVSGIVPDNQNTQSSGNGGQDPGKVDTGAKEVPGGNYTPPDKSTPATPNSTTSTSTTTTTNPNGTTTTTTTTTDVSGTTHTGSLDWEP